MKPSLAVIILTFNEEANLAAALDSVKGWATEVFVVDSYSTDRTVEIALAYEADGARVVQHRFENYSAQWNWALSRLPVRAEWTLKLDADERVTPEFQEEVDRLTRTAPPDLHGVLFRRRLFFLGSPLRFGGARSNHDLRLWRTGRAVFEERPVNEHAVVQGRTAFLKSYVEHHDYKSISDWLDKHNRYSSLEAISLIRGNLTGDIKPRLFGSPVERRMRLRKLYYRLPGRALLYFLYRYFVRLGLLDGLAGFRYALLYAAFLYWIDLKRVEHRTTGQLPVILWPPRGAPHPVVARSELQQQVDATPRQDHRLNPDDVGPGAGTGPDMHPAIQHHQALANQWEGKYQKGSFASRERLIARCLEDLKLEGTTWLDAGCGTGRFSRLLTRKGCRVRGVDASSSMLAIARQMARTEGLAEEPSFQHVETIERLPFEDGAFDGILCSSVLEYVDSPSRCLSELSRTLKPGGVLLLTAPNRQSLLRGALVSVFRASRTLGRPWPRYLELSKHEYCHRGLRRFLEEFDFDVRSMVVFGGPFPRRLQRRRLVGSLLLAVAHKKVGVRSSLL